MELSIYIYKGIIMKGFFQAWQEVLQRIRKAELANIPRIFQEES